jgi:hypothetical protein
MLPSAADGQGRRVIEQNVARGDLPGGDLNGDINVAGLGETLLGFATLVDLP